MARSLYLDCFSGASGDMLLGALLDLGVPLQIIERSVQQLRLPDRYELRAGRQSRQGIAGVKFDAILPSETHDHPHDHSHAHDHSHNAGHHHGHGRNYREIKQLLERSHLSLRVKERAVAVFHRIAVAEGKIHGMAPDEVHFHEVGALDSIIDIVGFCAAWEHLGAPEVEGSRLVEGTGFLTCAHGNFPIPAPATLEILSGIPLSQVAEPYEFITPTGAALLAEFATRFGALEEFAVERIGYGLGTRDTSARPNVVRALLGRRAASGFQSNEEEVSCIETNLDDCTGEQIGYVVERLWEAQALEVYVTPVQMKKNRPGTLLTVLARLGQEQALCELLLRESSTFGVRLSRRRRMTLEREWGTVATPWGEVRVKVGRRNGVVWQRSPEYEDCRRVALAAGVPLREVMESALHAAAKS